MTSISVKEVPRGRIDCNPDSPLDWQKCPFGELVEVNPLYPMERGRGYPFLEMAAVKEGFGGISQYDTRPFEGSLSRFALNDTLFAKITPCAENGKVAFIDRLPADNGCGSTEFIVLSPKAEFDPFFVHSLAISPAIHSRAVSRMEGSTGRLRVTEETFKKWMWVSVPRTREEQTGIAETLKAADDHIRALEEQVRKAERVKRSLLQSFPPSPKHGTGTPLHCVADISSGFTKGRDLAGHETVEVAYLTVVNVLEGRVDISDLSTADVKLHEVEHYGLREGDILMTEGGDRDKVGRGSIWLGQVPRVVCQNHIFRVRLNTDEVRPWFVHYLLQTYSAKRYFATRAKQSSNLCSINSREMRLFELPTLTVKAQGSWVERLRAADAAIAAIEDQLTAARRVKQSLLQNLLTGKIRLKP